MSKEERIFKNKSSPQYHYSEISEFEIRVGKAYNYNPTITPEKFEIRITTPIENIENYEALLIKIKEWLKS